LKNRSKFVNVSFNVYSDDSHGILLVKRGRRIVGELDFNVLGSEIEANNLLVSEKCRKKGYGRFLVSMLKSYGEFLGLPITLTSASDAVKFYRKCGFYSASHDKCEMFWIPDKILKSKRSVLKLKDYRVCIKYATRRN